MLMKNMGIENSGIYDEGDNKVSKLEGINREIVSSQEGLEKGDSKKSKIAKNLVKTLINKTLILSYQNGAIFKLLNKMMMIKVRQEDNKKTASAVDKEKLCQEHDWQMVDTAFFHGKKNISIILDKNKNKYILKTGRIEPCQIKLLAKAKEMENKLCFRVPEIIERGKNWVLLEKVEGKLLNVFYDLDPDKCVEWSKKIADDYQKLIMAVSHLDQKQIDLEGEQWLYSRLNLWSQPLLDMDMIGFELVREIKADFAKSIAKKKGELFGLFHGNITGDHTMLMVSGKPYLFDLHMVARAGKGYHDFLRALDFMFLKTNNPDDVFGKVPGWMKQYLAKFDKEEVKLVFAFRAMGAVGWDIIRHKGDEAQGDINRKIGLLLKFINREVEY